MNWQSKWRKIDKVPTSWVAKSCIKVDLLKRELQKEKKTVKEREKQKRAILQIFREIFNLLFYNGSLEIIFIENFDQK